MLRKEVRALKKKIAILELAPREKWPATLEEAGITKEAAFRVIDTIVVQLKPWKEKVTLGNGLVIEMSTTSRADARRLDEWAESRMPHLDTTVASEHIQVSMAASLRRYGSHDFNLNEGESEDARYQRAYDFLNGAPGPVFALIQRKISDFTKRIEIIFSEGYLENF